MYITVFEINVTSLSCPHKTPNAGFLVDVVPALCVTEEDGRARTEPGRPGLLKPSTHADRGEAMASQSPVTTAGAPPNSKLLPKDGDKDSERLTEMCGQSSWVGSHDLRGT